MQTSTAQLIEEVVPFRAGDGMQCQLLHVRGETEPIKGPVIVVHGAGVRSNIFRAPVEVNLVDFLVENGYDVWMEDWRASTNLPPNRWNLDQAAKYDHPEAVKKVVEKTGWDEMKAIIHCQGSTSFAMSAVAGLVPQVKTIITNAVSLHPVVPPWSAFKINWAIPMVKLFTKYLNPQWGKEAPTNFAKFLNWIVQTSHHECDNPVCKQVSFTYGSGFPALWRHENLNEATHQWLADEFGAVPTTFYDQMKACVRAGHMVSEGNDPVLPADFTTREPQTEARFAFFTGAKNLCFLPDSQVRSFEFVNGFRKNYHSLHVLPTYSHLDVFMGKNAATEVFPLMLAKLEKG